MNFFKHIEKEKNIFLFNKTNFVKKKKKKRFFYILYLILLQNLLI